MRVAYIYGAVYVWVFVGVGEWVGGWVSKCMCDEAVIEKERRKFPIDG